MGCQLTSNLTCIAFMAIIDHAVKEVCTKEMVKKSFSVTGIIPFNPNKIDLSAFPSSSAGIECTDSPIKVTCSSCRARNVELHPAPSTHKARCYPKVG